MDEDNPEIKISVYASAGNSTNDTIKLKGVSRKMPLSILIDTGSTHSFIDPIAARDSWCLVKATKPLLVSVADGNKLVCDAN